VNMRRAVTVKWTIKRDTVTGSHRCFADMYNKTMYHSYFMTYFYAPISTIVAGVL